MLPGFARIVPGESDRYNNNQGNTKANVHACGKKIKETNGYILGLNPYAAAG